MAILRALRDRKLKYSSENDPVYQDDISADFVVILRIFRFLGCCPLTFKRNQPADLLGPSVHYSFKWKSFATFYTALVLLTYSFCSSYVTFLICTGGYKGLLNVGKAKKTILDWVLISFMVIFYAWTAINPLLFSIRSCCLAVFLNKVDYISQTFRKTFPGKNLDFLKSKHTIYFILKTNTVGAVVFSIYNFYSYKDCIFDFKSEKCSRAEALKGLIGVTGVSLGCTLGFIEDVVILSLFAVVEDMLMEVVVELEGYSDSALKIANIKNWLKLGRSIKQQAYLLSRILGPEELSSIFVCFTACLLLAYMIMNISLYNTDLLLTGAFFCFCNLIRIHIKAYGVKRISQLESKILHVFVNINAGANCSLRSECERSFIASMIACRPIKFVLGNVLTLDSGLAVWLIGGVVTYLIVLLQFQG